MSCVDELFIGDTGTSIEFLIKECDNSDVDNPVEVIVDVSQATAFQLNFLNPDDGTVLPKTDPEVKLLTDGTDGLVHYLTIETDLSVSGPWKAQLRVTMASGKWYTSKISFTVKEPI